MVSSRRSEAPGTRRSPSSSTSTLKRAPSSLSAGNTPCLPKKAIPSIRIRSTRSIIGLSGRAARECGAGMPDGPQRVELRIWSNQMADSRQERQDANAAKMVGRNPWLALLVLCLGFFMILLDTTIVNIAIPSIIDGLHSTLDEILWVLNAYVLVYAVLLITASRLGDRYGQRNLFVAGLAVFTLASALCGLAQDSNQLIAGRVIQGIGGALVTPQAPARMSVMFPPQRRGTAMGIWGAVAGVAPVAGPTLGGFIVTNSDWRWVFYVTLPV